MTHFDHPYPVRQDGGNAAVKNGEKSSEKHTK